MLKTIRIKAFILITLLLFAANRQAGVAAPPRREAPVSQQDRRVTGTVSDKSGPVAGVSVGVKETTNGTITGNDGRFTLEEVSTGDVIRVSFLGYVTQEITYTGQSPLSILLAEDVQMLEEVVVTALGVRKEAKKLGYAVTTINADELVRTGTPNFAAALYGKASGVRIQAAPGGGNTSAVSVNVRGLSSINGNNQPLLIIDGVPVRNGNANTGSGFSDFGSEGRIRANGLVDINPEDIETLTILKGASATALYGSEAANGVVMITGKSGKTDSGLNVDFNFTLTRNDVAFMPKVQTRYGPGQNSIYWDDYAKQTGGFMEREYNGQRYKSIYGTSKSWGPKYDGSEVLYWDGRMRKYEPYTDNPWNELFQPGFNQVYNVAVSQGSEKTGVRLSYTYINDDPNTLTGDYEKHNFNLTGSLRFNDKISVSYSVNYIRQDVRNRPYSSTGQYTSFNTNFGSFEDIGLMKKMAVTSLGYRNGDSGEETLTPNESFAWWGEQMNGTRNVVWDYYGHNVYEDNTRLISSIAPVWEIGKGLTLRARASTDLTSEKEETMNKTERPLELYDPSGSYRMVNRRYQIFYGDLMLMYEKELTGKLGLQANLGWQGRRENMYNAQSWTEGGLTTENWFSLNAGRYQAKTEGQKQELLKTGYFGVLSLSWVNALYLETTVRHEKTSTLKKGSNRYTYPSVSLAYIFTESLKDAAFSWYDYGKARISYGIAGNAPEVYSANLSYNQQSNNGFTWNNVSGSLGNEKIKPETKYEWELGLESKFFKNRLGLEVSFYSNKVKDQILSTPMPRTSGAESILLNVGEIQNRGWEISLYGTPVQTRDFEWEILTNYAINKNRVNSLAEGIEYIRNNEGGGGGFQIQSNIGQPVGDIYVYLPLTNEKGDRIVESSGMYKIDWTERKKVGNAMPKMIGGIGNSFRYKRFFLDAMIDFRIGGDVVNEAYQYSTSRGLTPESLNRRDAASGGLAYYFAGNDYAKGNTVATTAPQGPNGETVYHNGRILPGVKEDGTPNNIIIPTDTYYSEAWGWGASGNISYEGCISGNSFMKVRELCFGYRLPESLTSKIACKNLSLSVFGRNLFYLFKSMKNWDAESTNGTSWISQSVVSGSTANTRSFGLSLRAGF
jgi:TonB-linked SusC/RagA family outer membrane protein